MLSQLLGTMKVQVLRSTSRDNQIYTTSARGKLASCDMHFSSCFARSLTRLIRVVEIDAVLYSCAEWIKNNEKEKDDFLFFCLHEFSLTSEYLEIQVDRDLSKGFGSEKQVIN